MTLVSQVFPPAQGGLLTYSMITRVWPSDTWSPSFTGTSLTVPSLGALISFSIFIASSTIRQLTRLNGVANLHLDSQHLTR